MHCSRRQLMGAGAGLAACGALGALDGQAARAEAAETDYGKTVYKVYPVGRVRNKKGRPVQLEIFEKFVPALHGLECCSHVVVVWWFHKNDTPILDLKSAGSRRKPKREST